MASESSSAKKVARAARAGGKVSSGKSRDFTFPAVLGVICVLGVLLVTYARTERIAVAAESPKLGEHWHAAYGVYICGSFEAPLSDTKGDRIGIHTHDDGLIHIHPFSSLAAGNDAQIGDFFEEMSIEIKDDDTTLVMPDGREFSNGDDCEGGGPDNEGGPGELQLVRWNRVLSDGDEDGRVIEGKMVDAQFDTDGEGWVLAFVPADTEIPKPLSAAALPNVSDIIDPNAEIQDPADGITVETDNGDVSVEVENTDTNTDTDSSDDEVTTTTAG